MIWEEAITEAFQHLEEAGQRLELADGTTGGSRSTTNHLLAAIGWALTASQLPRVNMSERVAAAAYKYLQNQDDESLENLKNLVSGWVQMVLQANPHLREKVEAAPEGGSESSPDEG